ncbi:hypothetical protein ACFFSO_02520, partial [Amorphoplanes nipponensis]
MPHDITARHRAGGVGRLVAVRGAAPRHAAPAPVEPHLHRRRLRRLAVPAVLLLAAVTPLLFRAPVTPRAAVPPPVVSVPPPPTATEPPAPAITRRPLHAVRQAAKA